MSSRQTIEHDLEDSRWASLTALTLFEDMGAERPDLGDVYTEGVVRLLDDDASGRWVIGNMITTSEQFMGLTIIGAGLRWRVIMEKEQEVKLSELKKIHAEATAMLLTLKVAGIYLDFRQIKKACRIVAERKLLLSCTIGCDYLLTWTKTGSIRADVNNIKEILMHDEQWQGCLAYCDFSCSVNKIKKPPFANNNMTGEWSDDDTARLRCWLADRYGFSPKTSDADDAVLVAAQAQRYHPVRDYLAQLVWDETPRLEYWIADFLGATQNKYTAAVGLKWLIGAVARVYEPGCKMDNVLILEGGQGKGKSTALAILGGKWFSDTHFELGNKDAYQQMRGVWMIEMAELDAFNKAETTKAKAFFSAQTDNYRPSYGRRTVQLPRQCVFAGSTNQYHYLKDVTGNRRYWPVRCNDINLDGLREARDQLLAEAVAEYRKGTPWRVLPGEIEHFEDAQEERYMSDSWEDKVDNWLWSPDNKVSDLFTTGEIMEGALLMQPKDISPPAQTRVGLIMSRLGWEKVRRRRHGTPTHMYQRPKRDDDDMGDPPL